MFLRIVVEAWDGVEENVALRLLQVLMMESVVEVFGTTKLLPLLKVPYLASGALTIYLVGPIVVK